MKATLIFNLDDAEDNLAHKRCIFSEEMALALWEIHHNLMRDIDNIVDRYDFNDNTQEESLSEKIWREISGKLPEGLDIDSLIR